MVSEIGKRRFASSSISCGARQGRSWVSVRGDPRGFCDDRAGG